MTTLRHAGPPGQARPRQDLPGAHSCPAPPDPGGHPDTGLRVAVLGPLVITGTAAELQPRQAELVVALALAGAAGLTGESLRGMLGADADHPKPPDSLRQIITRTRRRLGLTPRGGEYIIHGGNTRYSLDPAAALDWHEFRGLASRGQAGQDARPLRAALALLRGQPLAGLYYWWLDSALIETMRGAIVDVAALLARLELEAGNPAAARRAARSGLAADTAAEQLWRMLMLAEDASGNTAGVHGAWRGCLAAIADIAPDGDPHPDTSALYRKLTSRRPAAIRAGQAAAVSRGNNGRRAHPRRSQLPERRRHGQAAG